MLVQGILEALYGIFSVLTSPISIPSLPAEVHVQLENFFGYIEAGLGILANYTHLGYLVTLFGIVVAVDVGILLYKFVMWVLRKIPMLGIS